MYHRQGGGYVSLLTTGCDERDVYVIPLRESGNSRYYWLLLTDAYGVFDANVTWQDQSHCLLLDLGLSQLDVVRQFIYVIWVDYLGLMVGKIVDDPIGTDLHERVEGFLDD